MIYIFYFVLLNSLVSAYTNSLTPAWMMLRRQNNMKWSRIKDFVIKRHVQTPAAFYVRDSEWLPKLWHQRQELHRETLQDFIKIVNCTKDTTVPCPDTSKRDAPTNKFHDSTAFNKPRKIH